MSTALLFYCFTQRAPAASSGNDSAFYKDAAAVAAIEEAAAALAPGGPRDGAEAAAAQHQPAEPSVQQPHAPPILLLHPPPHVKHDPARQFAPAVRRNLLRHALQCSLSKNPHGLDRKGLASVSFDVTALFCVR